MRAAYRYLGIGIAVLVVFQAAALAFGTFGLLHMVDDGKAITTDTRTTGENLHSVGAIVLSVLVLAMLIVSFFVKAEGAVKWAGIVFGLTLLQWVLAIAAFGIPAIGFLHGINAFAIAAVAGIASRVVRVEGIPAATAPAAAV